MDDYYETAQVCLNGHVITSGIESSKEMLAKFCSTCGKSTLTTCPACSIGIRGYHHIRGVILSALYTPPNFCYNCGKSFPWLEEKLNAAKELANELENLTTAERDQLKQSLDDLIVQSPKTDLAITRFKKLAAKAGLEAANALKSILIDIVTESAKTSIWGNT